MSLVENLKWRYATKKFDATKKVSEEDINYIKEAVQLSASSYGLQAYKILEIKDPKLREELKPMSWNHAQITDASHLFVFCNYLEVKDKDIKEVMKLKSEVNSVPMEKLAAYGDFVNGKLQEKSADEITNWTARQTYIALGNALNACAELRLDSLPMEGFEPKLYNERLGLKAKNLNACVLLAVGYRHAEDAAQNNKKVRKSIDTLFEEI